MDGNTKAIAETLRRWYANEPKPAVVIDLNAERKRREHLNPRTRPEPPRAA